MKSKNNKQGFRQVAVDAAQVAGKMLLKISRKKVGYTMKNSHDILSVGDLKSEKIIIDKIKKHFPEHAIFSEEAGHNNFKSDYLWTIDPIDGTINFSNGIEEYAVVIALAYKEKLILGVVYQPALNKLYVAEKGKGAYLNGKKIKVSKNNKIINAILATDNSHIIDQRQNIFKLLEKMCQQVRQARIFGSAALHLTRMAAGQIDLYYKVNFNYWDYAASTLIVEEAGGKVTDFEGKKITPRTKSIVASNKILHKKFMQLLHNK